MSAPADTIQAKRISTGIAGLDVLLQGGFLTNRSYVLAGDAGTGKTIACMQFMLAGLEHGETAVYVTVDERPADILQAALGLELNLAKYIQEKKLVILDASLYFSGRPTGAGEKAIDLSRFVTDLADYATKLKATRLTIDPVTPLILSRDPATHPHDNARTLLHLLHTQVPTTNLLTAHFQNGSTGTDSSGIEQFISAGVIILSLHRTQYSVVRTLQIKKMRGTAVEPSEHQFRIGAPQGIVLLAAGGAVSTADLAPRRTLQSFELPAEAALTQQR